MIESNFGFRAAATFLLQEKVRQDLVVRVLDFLRETENDHQFVLKLNANWQDIAKVITALNIYNPEESGNLLMCLTTPILAVERKDSESIFGHEKDPSMDYVQGVVLGLFEAADKLDELGCRDSSLEVDLLSTLEKLIFCEGIEADLSGCDYPFREDYQRKVEQARSEDWRAFESRLSSVIKSYTNKSSFERCEGRCERLNRFSRRICERLDYMSSFERLSPISDVIIKQFCYGLAGKLSTEEFLQKMIRGLSVKEYEPYVFEGPLREFWAVTVDGKLYRIIGNMIMLVGPVSSHKLRTSVFHLSGQREEELDHRIGITLHDGIVLYQPGKPVKGKYRPAGCCSLRKREMTTAPIAGLFAKQSEARRFHNLFGGSDDNPGTWEISWYPQTEQILKLIGDDHPDFVLDNELLEQIGLDPKGNPARRKSENLKQED